METFLQRSVVALCLFLMGFFPVVLRHVRGEPVQKERSHQKITTQLKTPGVLILAHGVHTNGHGAYATHAPETVPPWNAAVLEAVDPMKDNYPLEVAFGMADPETIRNAVRKLEEKGVTDVVVVPLFISSHSPIISNSRYLLGLQEDLPSTTDVTSLPRIRSKMKFTMTEALNDSPLVAEILLERAEELSTDPARETVILVGHGPNDEHENKLWLKDMGRLASYVRDKGRFKEVKAATWRSDAPKSVKEKAAQELRKTVETGDRDGRVIIIPHLIAPGGVEHEITEVLKGLSYAYNGKTLLPHSNITRWVKTQVEKELEKLRRNDKDAG